LDSYQKLIKTKKKKRKLRGYVGYYARQRHSVAEEGSLKNTHKMKEVYYTHWRAGILQESILHRITVLAVTCCNSLLAYFLLTKMKDI
jgi:hypothetical protein